MRPAGIWALAVAEFRSAMRPYSNVGFCWYCMYCQFGSMAISLGELHVQFSVVPDFWTRVSTLRYVRIGWDNDAVV